RRWPCLLPALRISDHKWCQSYQFPDQFPCSGPGLRGTESSQKQGPLCKLFVSCVYSSWFEFVRVIDVMVADHRRLRRTVTIKPETGSGICWTMVLVILWCRSEQI